MGASLMPERFALQRNGGGAEKRQVRADRLRRMRDVGMSLFAAMQHDRDDEKRAMLDALRLVDGSVATSQHAVEMGLCFVEHANTEKRPT